jgi:hypothetical protein
MLQLLRGVRGSVDMKSFFKGLLAILLIATAISVIAVFWPGLVAPLVFGFAVLGALGLAVFGAAALIGLAAFAIVAAVLAIVIAIIVALAPLWIPIGLVVLIIWLARRNNRPQPLPTHAAPA